jgi:fatty-acyl-CoA synthase
MSYAHGVSTVPLLGETIGENLRRTVLRVSPDREAVVFSAERFRATYRDFWDRTEACARALLALGVAKGDRVAVFSPNRHEWIVLQYAAARVGAILVNVNPAYRTHELAFALEHSGTSVLFLAPAFRATDYLAMLAGVRAECPRLAHVVVFTPKEGTALPLGAISWSAFLDRGAHVPAADVEAREAILDCDDPVSIQFTSGTTGVPKGATLSHHNILNNAFFVAQAIGLTEKDKLCVPVPFYHCFGMVMGNLAATATGATIVVPGEAFDAEKVLEAIAVERCTALYGVPTMFIAELDHPRFAEFDLTCLRTGIMAGAPCPVDVMRQVTTRMHMHEVTIAYGMTETSPVSTQTGGDDPVEKRVGTVGRVHPHVEIKIVDPESGRTVPRGESGEFCTRGYSVMRGYWRAEAATQASIDEGGWMHTGDLATMDDEGYVNIVGRIKDMVIRGGENIYPREVEEFLHGHPDVSQVEVIGVPSAKYGEELMAWVRVRSGATLEEASLVAFCTGKIATYKIPRYWKIVTEFPMTVTGKVQKFKMREIAVKELGLEAVLAAKTA